MLLGYSKQAYHKGCRSEHLRRQREAQAQACVLEKVAAIRSDMPRIGTRKLHYLLKKDSCCAAMGRDRLFDCLRENGMLVARRRKYVRTTDSSQWRRQYGNLVEGSVPGKPEEVLVADITYFETEEEGHVYGHLLSDAYSKRIMGYAVEKDMSAGTTLKALEMAVGRRQYDHEMVHHSDRGLQYCSRLYTEAVKSNKGRMSMTQSGSPYDNAVAERINGILKDEFGLGERLRNLEEVRRVLEKAVEVYNEKRPHWSCGLLTPNEMHGQQSIPVRTYRKKETG